MLGDRLRSKREEKGMSQVELSRLTGMTQPLISMYERNKVDPTTSMVKYLCEVLEITASELLGF